MNRKLLLSTLLVCTLNLANAQVDIGPDFYFDGTDSPSYLSFLHFDTSSSNIWQVGRPQKNIFDSAATLPNALITDTVNAYPTNNISRFIRGINFKSMNLHGAVAFRWKQKLDLDTNRDGAIIEYSIDTGKTWLNAFNNSQVYNFYGFDSKNIDTLLTGEYAFSGTDSVWRDIWFCLLGSTLQKTDTFMLRFTLKTDSIDNNREGWIIDNMLLHITMFHTVNKVDPANSFLVYPTITSGIVKVAAGNNESRINSIVIVDAQGKIVERYHNQTEPAVLDISGLPQGHYFVHMQADEKIEVHKVLLAY
ncbi:MAG TPA: T9SS type A sorting domain-containing protein [Flavipsychrobacter sp.]|nr:T9SS type A sorting domain-containing protein [Flavipsychrobacter sp.]